MTTSIYNRTQNFLNKAKLIHNDKYDYSLVEYVNSTTKVKIICPIHGIFNQLPLNHNKGHNCKECGNLTSKEKRTSNNEIFIHKSKIIHNNKYDYSLVNYVNAQLKVKIICPIHGTFEQLALHHIKGNGCKECSNGKYNITTLNRDSHLANKDTTLYIIKHENLYKIGITTLSVFQRFNKSIQVISELNNITLLEAFTKEQEILSKYNQFKERPNNWKYKGDSEFLNITSEQINQIQINYFIL